MIKERELINMSRFEVHSHTHYNLTIEVGQRLLDKNLYFLNTVENKERTIY